MAWLESHQALSKHRKTIRAAGLLKTDRHKLIGHLHELWWWGIDNVDPDGYLQDLTDYELAMAAEWTGDAEEFVAALVDAGFIDVTDEGRYFHDWYDYAGKWIERREKERERAKARRNPDPPPNPPKDRAPERPSDGTPDVAQTANGTLHKSTVHNKTKSSSTKLGGSESSARAEASPPDSPAAATAEGVKDAKITPPKFYEGLWGTYPPVIDRVIQAYENELEPSAIKWAIWDAHLSGNNGARYLRSILERLRVEGLTTAKLAEKDKAEKAERRNGKARASPANHEGAPNASAYNAVDTEAIKRWKELYPDEYDTG